ncbi:peptidylprolyl isomerase [Archangium violaceum]|uniref:peptidylprolyl isomerase n=1 Tax=Archangium violaceum TaxID=83451 RepID=UPI00193C5CB5|nr:peptidylprolyl isomerase [Archangium violaceum]QRK04339.1 peptidylprolyl isomerase [Archangium violaceum]
MPTMPEDDRGDTGRSLGELQGRMLLKRAPGMRALEGPAAVTLPDVPAPSLEGLRVAAIPPAPVTREDLLERLEALFHERAPRRERAPDERVALGDEVLLDVIGYAHGALIPFSVRVDWRVLVAEDPLLPGFFEGLVGARVGLSMAVELQLPDTYGVAALRGATARFLVDVKAAYELQPLDFESPELLPRLGLGATLEEAMRHIAEALADEREEEAWLALQERVLDALVERTEVDIPERLVDEEIRLRWLELEQPVLASKNFTLEEMEEAWRGWSQDPLTRRDAELRLRVAVALRAICVRDGLQPDAEDVEKLGALLAEAAGLPPEGVEPLLRSTPGLAERFTHLLLHTRALEHVMSRVELTGLDSLPQQPVLAPGLTPSMLVNFR